MPYYVRINGRSHGPFDESKLLELKSRGTISRTTEVSENDRDWCAAAETFLYPDPLPPPPHNEQEPQEIYGIRSNAQMEIPAEMEFRRYGGTASPPPEPSSIDIKGKIGSFAQRVVDSFDVSEPGSIPLLSRFTYIFLAAMPFTGVFGVQDFYAKRNGAGAVHIACWAPWIFVLLSSVFIAFLGGLGIHVRVDWFQPASLQSAERGAYWMYLFFVVLPVASYVMALLEIVFVTKDGVGREFERF